MTEETIQPEPVAEEAGEINFGTTKEDFDLRKFFESMPRKIKRKIEPEKKYAQTLMQRLKK
jgi:hypothetical protein